jgi:RNA polymerase sigma factor (sigma-70 family)
VSNSGRARIIDSRSWYQKSGFAEVNDGLNQQSWAGIPNGDAEVWQEFLHTEIPRLYGMFMRRWPNPSLAEELVQRTVFDAVRGRDTYDPAKGSPAEWVFGIARNTIRLEIRRRAGRPSVDGDISKYVETIDSEPLPDEVLEQKETADVVRAALERLESKERAVLKAKYIEGLTAREIGKQLGITEKAAHSLLYRARVSLREELARETALNKQGQEL